MAFLQVASLTPAQRIIAVLADFAADAGAMAVVSAKSRVRLTMGRLLSDSATTSGGLGAGLGGGKGSTAPLLPPGMPVALATASSAADSSAAAGTLRGGGAGSSGRQIHRLTALAVYGWVHEHLLIKSSATVGAALPPEAAGGGGSGAASVGAVVAQIEEALGALLAGGVQGPMIGTGGTRGKT